MWWRSCDSPKAEEAEYMGDYSPQDMKKSIGKTINTKRIMTALDVEKQSGLFAKL
jgi:hypothetical protein